MSLTTEEQELFDIARAALPEWYANDRRANEFLVACAKIFGAARAISSHWLSNLTLITLSSVDLNEEPDWLDQHARDRGSSRQLDEADNVLIDRIRNVPDALTRPVLLAALQAMMTAGGFSGTVAMEEMPRDLAHFGTYTGFGGSRPPGTITIDAIGNNEVLFYPADESPFSRPPFERREDGPDRVFKLDWSDGTPHGPFEIIGLVGKAAKYVDPTQADFVPGGSTVWNVKRYDSAGNLTDGFARAYFSRGYRMGSCPPSKIIVILPFGTTEAFRAAVIEMLRQKKAGGVKAIVERRLNA